MACGTCGNRGNSLPRITTPVKVHSLQELREKIINSKANILPNKIQSVQNNIIHEQVFKAINENTNPLTLSVKKAVVLIYREGNAEGKYLKNIINKFAIITPEYKNSIEFKELEYSHLINPEEFTSFPVTLFFNNNLYKKHFGLFDVRIALDELYKLPT